MPGKKLLVADDSLTIQKVIRLALSNEGYEIQAVADGNDAINQILLFRPDVVLIDVSLPGKNAFEVKREVNGHEDLLETRFVLISSAFEKVDELQVEEVEFHGRLTKPFDPAHLRKILSTVLDQVTAKRLEPTSLLRRPPPSPDGPPEFLESSLSVNEDQDFPLLNSPEDLPPLDFDPPPLPGSDFLPDPQNQENAENHLPIPPRKKSQFSDLTPEVPLDFDLPPLLPEEDYITTPPGQAEEVAFGDEVPLPPPAASFLPPPLPTQPLPRTQIEPTESSGEADIQQLTESTMRISGMDDYQWSMNEPSTIPPPPSMEQGSSFELPPPPPSLELENHPSPHYYSELPEPEVDSSSDSNSPILVSEEKIDAMIHNQIESTLEKMIEKLLPQIAEKLIKEEIHRLLSE